MNGYIKGGGWCAAILVGYFMLIPVIVVAQTENVVSISPAVQQQIQKLSKRNQKRIEAAINAGNLFIPYYLDGSYYLVVDEDMWGKNIRPLVNKNSSDWYGMLLKWKSGQELEIAKKELTDQITICPHVELILYQLESELIKLTYRSRVVNVQKFKYGQPILVGLVLDESFDFQEVTIGIDQKNKVDYVEPKYYGVFGTTISFIDGYNSLIDNAFRDLKIVSPDKQAKINDDIRQYKEWIKLFQEQEALICITR